MRYTRTSAAALSAAVDTTKMIRDNPNLQAEPPLKKHPRQTPAALRERGSGGEALLSEKRPLLLNLPFSLTPCPRRIGRKPRRWDRKREPCRDRAKQRDRTFGEFAADCD